MLARELTESDYWRRYQQASTANGHPLDLKRELDWTGTERPEVVATIEVLGRRFRQATLSNDSSEWMGYGWWDTWPFAHLFEHVIDVVTLGVRKPHPLTYTTTADRMGLSVSECLFVDDMQINLDGAEAVGMPGFFFDHTRVAASCNRLLELLAPPPEGHES
ncbi:MAG: HAD-IA family hydrolase [Acidimicrobiia bacterium]|nr:HAD-IA family hydrolase [Acidimicrobiia bacterium]